eukprot:UN04266
MSLRFSGDFDRVVGNRAGTFLSQCNDQFGSFGVECTDVYEGSIFVEFVGTYEQLLTMEEYVVENGLELPDFESLAYESTYIEKDDDPTTQPTTRDRVVEEEEQAAVTTSVGDDSLGGSSFLTFILAFVIP